MKNRPWPSTVAFLLALPVVASLAACDTSSKPSSTCAGGKTGLSAAATCAPTTPGNTTPGNTTPGNTTPGNTTPTSLGATTNNADLVGTWGISGASQKGQAWAFGADGTYSVISYELVGTSANVEVTLAGHFAAANGTMNVTAEKSTCAGAAMQAALPYAIGGNQLTVDLGGGAIYTYTKDNAPNEQDYTLAYGCFNRETRAFGQSTLMTLQ